MENCLKLFSISLFDWLRTLGDIHLIFLGFHCYLILKVREDIIYKSPVSILLLSNINFITYSKKKVVDPLKNKIMEYFFFFFLIGSCSCHVLSFISVFEL